MKQESSGETIVHDGVVQKVSNGSVIVKISSASECSGCHAAGVCGFAGKEEKLIKVTGNYNVTPGDNVTVMMQQSMGYKAILLSYFIPFIIVVATLVTLISLSVSELMSGLVSIAVLAPYFLILCLFKKRIDQNFIFTLKT